MGQSTRKRCNASQPAATRCDTKSSATRRGDAPSGGPAEARRQTTLQRETRLEVQVVRGTHAAACGQRGTDWDARQATRERERRRLEPGARHDAHDETERLGPAGVEPPA